ncbi:hypothetical protein [Emticicia agri]|uniref:Uncharacterized protein n=1 Tax=Emticicia agri TaxID=2492393 RepID=A0A4Q5LNR8_9BACT|nr:hypothetical protein [Emticicia agri]RYU91007.1 hypothetical protein EWM59_27305 [Emticicia agri]
MIEYNEIISMYSSKMFSMYSTSIPEHEWGDKEVALEYLKKYFLSEEEYSQKWKPIQNSIFENQETGLPAMIFKDNYSLLAIRGGVLFEKEDFESLQNCIQTVGDSYLIIIQNDYGVKFEEPLLRMKYPVSVNWEELMSGNFVSSILFEMFHNEYFVFSESGNWGRYCANDYIHPLNIIGFKPELASVFKKEFKPPKKEQEEIREWLPPNYKEIVQSDF